MTTSEQTILLSKKGLKELKKSISRLERDQQQVRKNLRELDKIDNHEQRLARVEQLSRLEIIESALEDKRMTLSRSKLFPRKRDAMKVAIGSVVELIDINGRIFRYTLVDSIEANPSDGRISTESPLGKRLVGRAVKDTIDWSHGLTSNRFTLLSIH